MEVLFTEYFPSISRIFPYHGKHFHVKLDKTMEIGFGDALLKKMNYTNRTKPTWV